jgi:hypothetical protein
MARAVAPPGLMVTTTASSMTSSTRGTLRGPVARPGEPGSRQFRLKAVSAQGSFDSALASGSSTAGLCGAGQETIVSPAPAAPSAAGGPRCGACAARRGRRYTPAGRLRERGERDPALSREVDGVAPCIGWKWSEVQPDSKTSISSAARHTCSMASQVVSGGDTLKAECTPQPSQRPAEVRTASPRRGEPYRLPAWGAAPPAASAAGCTARRLRHVPEYFPAGGLAAGGELAGAD